MSTVLIFVIGIPTFLFVGFIGNKIVDKGEDAIDNAIKRKKNSQNQEKKENLADRYRS